PGPRHATRRPRRWTRRPRPALRGPRPALQAREPQNPARGDVPGNMTSLEADSVVGLLGPEGPFARKLPAYEARDGQLEVTRAVGQLLAEDGILLCEAGTGIGKTFAYLVPALLSGRKVVISTATRALQDQIAGRDIPLALEVL